MKVKTILDGKSAVVNIEGKDMKRSEDADRLARDILKTLDNIQKVYRLENEMTTLSCLPTGLEFGRRYVN